MDCMSGCFGSAQQWECLGGQFVGGRWRVGFSEVRCGVGKIVEGFAGVEVQAVKQIEAKYEEMDKA